MRVPDNTFSGEKQREVTSFLRHFPAGSDEWGRLNAKRVSKGDPKVTKKWFFDVNNDQKGCILATFGAGFGRLLPASVRPLGILSLFWPERPEGVQKVSKRVPKPASAGFSRLSHHLR